MDEENFEELEKFFIKIYNDPVCFFCFEETMKDAYKTQWNIYVNEPKSLDFMYQKLKSGEYEDPYEVKCDFISFIEKCEEFIDKMDLKGKIFESCFIEFKKTYLKKLNKVLMNENEKVIYVCDHNIRLVKEQYKRMMNFLDINERNDEGHEHMIPRKMDP